jgi:hypothetical protein
MPAVWVATMHEVGHPFRVQIVGVWPDTTAGRLAAQRACDKRWTPIERRLARRLPWGRYVDNDQLWERWVRLDRWAQVQRYTVGEAMPCEPDRWTLATQYDGMTLTQWREAYSQ